MFPLKFSTQEVLGVHLSSWTSQYQKGTLSLTSVPLEKSFCPSREDRGTNTPARAPVILARRYQS